MNAQVVFDLPIDGPFDYFIPAHLLASVTVGSRVKVSFGHKIQSGYVTGLFGTSALAELKPVLSLCEDKQAFDILELELAKDFASYYGCTLGEALGAMLRNRTDFKPLKQRKNDPRTLLYRCQPEHYLSRVREIIKGYGHQACFLILVPDIFRAGLFSRQFKGHGQIKIGTRSSVFECDGRFDCVIMVDEEDASFKQEQMPMYETRQVLMARSLAYGFDVSFVGVSPSVELMAQVIDNKVGVIDESEVFPLHARLVDLGNYKYVPGLISPPVRDSLQAVLKAGKKGILVLNRRGSYRLTRCVDCGDVLKCDHCDSSLIYSRSEGEFHCRHCTFTVPGDTVCPQCRKPSWRSQGIGVEQVQTELKKLFPQARIHAFERPSRAGEKGSFPEFDILVSTSAVLRFQGNLQVQMAAFIDFDAELNRLDMRSAFNAYSLALHVASMTTQGLLIQSRNIDHYVLQSLSRGNLQEFYDKEIKLRKEFGFSPFKHWVKIAWRGKVEKSVQEHAMKVYNKLKVDLPQDCSVTPPLADAVGRKRDQFRFNVMVQADQVIPAVAAIRSALASVRRTARVIVTMNVDP